MTRLWTSADLAILRNSYASIASNDRLSLDAIAKRLGRPKTSVCRKARELGLTDIARPKKRQRRLDMFGQKHGAQGSAQLAAALSAQARRFLESHPHPRGFAGRKHSAASRAVMGQKSRAGFARRTPDQEADRHAKRNATNLARYGTGAPGVLSGVKAFSRAKSGRRADLDNCYFRSMWEANYARYLNWLQSRGEIRSWRYEPKTFVFHGVTRGVLTYTPDFEVTEADGRTGYHEVKGWMDAKSKAKLRRMAQFYPDERVLLITQAEYEAIKKWASMIPGWESIGGSHG